MSKQRKRTMEWLKEVVARPSSNDCILWPFCVDPKSGYGIVQINGKNRTAHRVALILATNEDPPDKQASHGECHNRRCCNPLHLSWKTVEGNHADKVRDDTHNRGARHYRAKLTPEKVLAIVADKREHKIIAAEYGVSRPVVSAIKTGLHWNWLTKIKESDRVRKSKNRVTETAAPDGSSGGR